MSAAKKKQLFGEDSDSAGDDDAKAFAAEAEEGFKVNRAYASHYDQVKRKQELQRLSSKYGNVDDDDEDTDEDDDARLLTREAEADFAVLLKRLRSNDPTLRDKSVAFFRKQRSGDGSDSSSDDDDRPAKPSGKKFTLKDEFQRGVVATAEGEGGDDDDDGARGRRSRKAMTKEEKAARAAFLAAADQADTSAADFEVKEGTKGLARAAEKKSAGDTDDADASAAIAEALGKSGDADDAFLANFFGKAAWKNEPGAAEPEYTWEQEAADEQDEQFYDDAEQWEKEFQEKRFRHEEGDAAAQIQAFPRQQEGLLRQKDTSRKEARERKAERKAQEESKAVEELKRLKNLKKEEIRAFQRKIAEVAGLGRGGKKKPAKKGAKAADDEPVHPDDEDDDDASAAESSGESSVEDDAPGDDAADDDL
uniref:Kri1-like C-terminal domain-containing protein n=1 Tax=Neobodo designis TaxID=312471 RepID=A0A7S1L8G6_NEODS